MWSHTEGLDSTLAHKKVFDEEGMVAGIEHVEDVCPELCLNLPAIAALDGSH